MKRPAILCLLLVGFLAPAACSLGPKSTYPDEQHRYALQAKRAGPAKTARADTVLKIREFSISRRFEGLEFVQTPGGGEWVSDYYNVFFIPPAENLSEQCRVWIAASRLFGKTVSPSSLVEETHILEGHVSELYADYGTPGAFKAVMEIQIVLLDIRDSVGNLVAQGTYRQEVPVANDSASAIVAGWNKALTGILGEIEQAMAGSLSE